MEETNIFPADKLYEISKKQRPVLVEKVMNGIKEHIIMRCEQYANKGDTCYSIYLNGTYKYAEDLLFEKCLELIKEFENKGYKVSIDDCGSGNHINYILTFSWDGNLVTREGAGFGKNRHLYDTNNGVFTKSNFSVGALKIEK